MDSSLTIYHYHQELSERHPAHISMVQALLDKTPAKTVLDQNLGLKMHMVPRQTQ